MSDRDQAKTTEELAKFYIDLANECAQRAMQLPAKTSQKKPASEPLSRLILRLRWYAARPVLQPILDDMKEYENNLRRNAKLMTGVDWQERHLWIEKADTLGAFHSEIEGAFGRISYDENFHTVRHY